MCRILSYRSVSFRCWASALLIFVMVCSDASNAADETFHQQIDAEIRKGHSGKFSGKADDAEFLRRVSLDLTGVIPTSADARVFLSDTSPSKRDRLIDNLLASQNYSRRMQEAFSVMLMERRTNRDLPAYDWQQYFKKVFAENRRWDEIVRALMTADGVDEEQRPAIRFFLDRGPSSYDQLTRDVGRLFLGMDLQCAQCHDHPSIDDYKQSHYFGIFAYLNTTGSMRGRYTKTIFIGQRSSPMLTEFKSVFTGESAKTGPQLPGLDERELPMFKKGEEFIEKPIDGRPGIPKFDARAFLASDLTGVENVSFKNNIANRLWFLMMGRGLVHPLDMHHSDNAASHPELLSLLANRFAENGFDIKAFLREIARSETYQRSSRLPVAKGEIHPESYAAFNLKPLSAEQLFHSVIQATGQEELIDREIDEQLKLEDRKYFDILLAMPAMLARARAEKLAELRDQFVAAFSNPAGEPEIEFNSTLSGALFLSNNSLVLDWLQPESGNLIARLEKLNSAEQIAEELYLSILTRMPTDEERTEVAAHLAQKKEQRTVALGELAWALITSTEFRLNH